MSNKSQTLEFKPRTNSEHEHTKALWDIQVTQIEKVHDPQIKKTKEEKWSVAYMQSTAFAKKDYKCLSN